jgi:hypothetical protein
MNLRGGIGTLLALVMRMRHVLSNRQRDVYRGVSMKPNSKDVAFPTRNNNLLKLCVCAGLMTLLGFGILSTVQATQDQSGVPILKFTPEGSIVNFNVSASVPMAGKFDKWDASLAFTSREFSTGVLDIKIDAASVNTGSGMKDGKLRSKDFFDAKDDPYLENRDYMILVIGKAQKKFSEPFDSRGGKVGRE